MKGSELGIVRRECLQTGQNVFLAERNVKNAQRELVMMTSELCITAVVL